GAAPCFHSADAGRRAWRRRRVRGRSRRHPPVPVPQYVYLAEQRRAVLVFPHLRRPHVDRRLPLVRPVLVLLRRRFEPDPIVHLLLKHPRNDKQPKCLIRIPAACRLPSLPSWHDRQPALTPASFFLFARIPFL